MLSVAQKPIRGAQMVTGTGDGNQGPYCAIFCVATTTFAQWNEEGQTGTMTGVAFPANSWIFGNINSFKLTSGTCRAYKC